MVLRRLLNCHSGVRDWWFQRLSALALFAYVSILTYFWISRPQAGFAFWHGLIYQKYMMVLGTFVILSFVVHAWIGFWTVLTDYVHHKMLRNVILAGLSALILLESAWALVIMWGLI